MAGNTPFKRWKREVHEGGVTLSEHVPVNPLEEFDRILAEQ